MRQYFIEFKWRPNGHKHNQLTLRDEESNSYTWYTKTSMSALESMLKANISNTFEGVSVELNAVNGTSELMVITDSIGLWHIRQFRDTISRVLAIQEFIDRREWHEPDEAVEVED